jgi:hypothetical protein
MTLSTLAVGVGFLRLVAGFFFIVVFFAVAMSVYLKYDGKQCYHNKTG